MKSLRRLVSWKEDQYWTTVLNNWGEFRSCSTNSSLVESENWNPWRGWCISWEWYEQSCSKVPKSGKEKAALWRQLHCIAKITRDKLDEAIAMRHELKKQKAELTNLQQENLHLKAKCISLQESLDYEQQQIILYDQCHKRKLENQRQLAQKENNALQARLQDCAMQSINLELEISRLNMQLQEETERQKRDKKLLEDKKMEYQILDSNGEIVKVQEELNSLIQNFNIYQKNIITVNYPIIKELLEGGESWHEKAKRPGVGCPLRSKIWGRLQKYEDPNVTLKNATYWRLVVQLSRYEDLGTKQPR